MTGSRRLSSVSFDTTRSASDFSGEDSAGSSGEQTAASGAHSDSFDVGSVAEILDLGSLGDAFKKASEQGADQVKALLDSEALDSEAVDVVFRKACNRGDHLLVEAILKSEAEVSGERVNKSFRNACRRGDYLLVRVILKSEAEVSDERIKKEFRKACENGDTLLVSALLKLGKLAPEIVGEAFKKTLAISGAGYVRKCLLASKQVPSEVILAELKRIASSALLDKQLLRELIEQKKVPTVVLQRFVLWCIQCGKSKVLEMVCARQRKRFSLEFINKEGRTPLQMLWHFMISNPESIGGSLSGVMKVLLRYGADTTFLKQSPVQLHSGTSLFETEQADVSSEHPLMALLTLLENHGDSFQKKVALRCAANLIQSHAFDLNGMNSDGMPILHAVCGMLMNQSRYACYSNEYRSVVKALLQSGCDSDQIDAEGRTALEYAEDVAPRVISNCRIFCCCEPANFQLAWLREQEEFQVVEASAAAQP